MIYVHNVRNCTYMFFPLGVRWEKTRSLVTVWRDEPKQVVVFSKAWSEAKLKRGQSMESMKAWHEKTWNQTRTTSHDFTHTTYTLRTTLTRAPRINDQCGFSASTVPFESWVASQHNLNQFNRFISRRFKAASMESNFAKLRVSSRMLSSQHLRGVGVVLTPSYSMLQLQIWTPFIDDVDTSRCSLLVPLGFWVTLWSFWMLSNFVQISACAGQYDV